MGSIAQPLLNLKTVPDRLLNAVEHPVNTIESLLGFSPAVAPTPNPNRDPFVMDEQRAALKSFQDAAAKQNAPAQSAQLHQMKKPLGK